MDLEEPIEDKFLKRSHETLVDSDDTIPMGEVKKLKMESSVENELAMAARQHCQNQ